MYSLKYYEIINEDSEKFLKMKINDELSTMYQNALPGFDADEHTSIKYLGFSSNSNFRKYLINFEEKEDVIGRYKSEPIYYYIAREEIEVFKLNDNLSIFVMGQSKPPVRRVVLIMCYMLFQLKAVDACIIY